MAAQCSFEFTGVVGGGGGHVIFNITEGGLELIFLFWWGGEVLSKFLLDNPSFSAPPPDNYCTVPKSLNHSSIHFKRPDENDGQA